MMAQADERRANMICGEQLATENWTTSVTTAAGPLFSNKALKRILSKLKHPSQITAHSTICSDGEGGKKFRAISLAIGKHQSATLTFSGVSNRPGMIDGLKNGLVKLAEEKRQRQAPYRPASPR